MKITLSWLKDYLDTDASLEDISRQLTALGLEVDSIEDKAAMFEPFKVAYVESAVQHPNADRLRVCIVDTGEEKVQVVCGAPNARTGMKAIFAPTGSYIPGTDMTLQKGKIRGEESNGMLVSEREMGISDDHDGIIDLPADTAIGTPFSDLFGAGEVLIDIGLTPDRGDCAGIYGIARDLAATGIGTLKNPDTTPVEAKFDNPVSISLNAGEACPYFLGRMIKGVKNGPSPDWLQQKLKSVGLRPISALVDVTNYFTHAYARPLHVFDGDKLQGNLSIKSAQGGESLNGLNDKSYTLQEGQTVVCDDSGVLALGGIVGGVESGCTEETGNVYLECAYFDPARTARTGRDLQIDSDARYRFDRGVDPEFMTDAVEMATRMIIELCGGEASDVAVAGDMPDVKREIVFHPVLTEKLGGVDIAEDQQKEILQKLGFSFNGNTVTTPSWRHDVEGKADLVEEVLRVYGYDNIPPVSMVKEGAVTKPALSTQQDRRRNARRVLAGRGYDECVTWSFMSYDLAGDFMGEDAPRALTLSNPISEEMKQMRPSILPNLIEAGARSAARGYPGSTLFEIGPIFRSPKVDGQAMVASSVRCGAYNDKHWSVPARDNDIYDVKSDVMAVIESTGLDAAKAQISKDAPSYYHPGRSGALRLGPNVLAYFGEIHPAILQKMDVKFPVCASEVFIENIPEPKVKTTARPLLNNNSLQPVSRDFAFIVKDDVAAQDVIGSIRGALKDIVRDIRVFDVYTGKGVEDGHKSLALSVSIQPQEKTLTDADLEAISNTVVENVAKKTGGTLRA